MTESAYNTTTEPNTEASSWWTSRQITPLHLLLKIAQLGLSLVAFICEEIIDTCNNCAGLYFFEFVSCSAVLLSILFIAVYCLTSSLIKNINIKKFKKIDFCTTAVVCVLLFISSIVFASTIEGSSLSTTSVIFGFFAAFVFLADAVLMWRHRYFKQENNTPATAANGAHETEQLNRNPL